jgi:hypothetical protein
MSALVGTRFNPVLKAFYQRLCAAGGRQWFILKSQESGHYCLHA